jgi:hypothetical protein
MGSGSKGAGGRGGKGTDAEDSLYQVPLTEFTAARNALVTRLKKGGKPEEAQRIKGLVKPSTSAWAVNQLYWHYRPKFDALMAVGERFRQAQAAQLQGRAADLRGPLEERREALSALAKLAAATLTDAGLTPTPDTMRRVTSTLEALSVLGSEVDTGVGRLIDDVDPPGFESLAALVPRVAGGDEPTGPSRVLTFHQQRKPVKAPPSAPAQRKAEIKSAQAAVQEAERGLRTARKEAERAEGLLKQAAQRAKEVDRARADAEKRLEKAAADADAARQSARKTAAAAEEAAQAVTDAERALDKAKQELIGLG